MRIVDLSLPIRNHSFDPSPQQIIYEGHMERARLNAKLNRFELDDFYAEVGMGAQELVTASTHSGTHVDAPYHFGPEVAGAPARTIDQVPLEWCYGDGVVLDFSDRPVGYVIRPADLETALARIDYRLKAGDIVLIRTGADRRFDRSVDYAERHCGLGVEAFDWLLDRGIRAMGTDAFTLDIPIPLMIEALKSGNKAAFFPIHFQAARRREHIHAEKLCNLDQLPRPSGFKVAMFPVKVERGSGAWARVVAILDD